MKDLKPDTTPKKKKKKEPPKHAKPPCAFNRRPLPDLDLQKASKVLDPALGSKVTAPTEPEPTETSLIVWMHWYIYKRVAGTSDQTKDAKYRDLQKFINYFYMRVPSGDLKLWNTDLSKKFAQEMIAAGWKLTSVVRTVASIKHFGNALLHWKCQALDAEVLLKFGVKIDQQPEPDQLLLIKDPRKPPLLEGDEVFTLLADTALKIALANKSSRKRPYRDLAIIYFLYYSGARASELCNVNREQMERNMDGSGGAMFRNVIGKGETYRTLYLAQPALDKLDLYFNTEREDYDGPLFQSSRKNRPLSRHVIWEIVDAIRHLTEKRLNDEPGFPDAWRGAKIKVHPHTFRHGTAYNLLDSPGMKPTEAADFLGHSDLRQIQRYARQSEKAQLYKFNQALSGKSSGKR